MGMRKPVIGVMGPREARESDIKNAYELGKLIAENGWITLNGGMALGVMDAVSRGANENGGMTIGILPNNDPSTWSKHLDICIVTNMADARNAINAQSSDVLIAVGISAGTASEVAFAIREKKPVILLGNIKESVAFFKKLDPDVRAAETAEEAIKIAKNMLK